MKEKSPLDLNHHASNLLSAYTFRQSQSATAQQQAGFEAALTVYLRIDIHVARQIPTLSITTVPALIILQTRRLHSPAWAQPS